MKNLLSCFLILPGVIILLASRELSAAPGGILLAENGKTSYVIIPPEAPLPMELLAVRELKDGLKRTTKAEFKTASSGAKAIRLVRDAKLGKEVCSLEISGQDILLKGGDRFGMVYAVYTFLEDQLGIRFYTRWGENKYPRHKRLAVSFKPYTRKMAYPERTILCHDNYRLKETLPFYFRNRLNLSNAFRKIPGFPGTDTIFRENTHNCHTLFFYIPPRKGAYPELLRFKTKKYYFKDHKEFFSMDKNGKRVMSMQLCFSNQELRKEFKRRLYEHIELTGKKEGIYSVSAQDYPGKFCYCKGCEALAKKYRSNTGPLVDFILELCKEVKKKYPKLYISTLAYRKEQSECPPDLKGKKMPENFICVFAPIDDDFSKPLDHPNNKGTLENIRKWAKISRHLWMWYYPLPYGGNAPYISLERNAKDVRLMLEAGATGAYFEHDVGLWDGCNFADLLNFLLLQLIQDPGKDYKKIVKEYCDFMYGKASSDMQEYISILDGYSRKNKVHWIWNGGGLPEALTPENLLRYTRLFDRMEKKVSSDKKALAKIGEVRFMLDLCVLRKYKEITKGKKAVLPPPEVIRKRIEKNLKGAIDFRMRDNLKSLGKTRMNRYRLQIRDAYIYATVTPGKLPAPLDKIPEKRIRQLIPARVNKCGMIKMKDAAFGVAIHHNKKGLALPFPCGFYDQVSKRFILNRTIKKEEIVPDRFHLYKVGSAPIGQGGYLWTTNWQVGISTSSLYIPGESPDKKYDLYLSIKFEGPSYSSRSRAKKDMFYIDRAVIVDPVP